MSSKASCFQGSNLLNSASGHDLGTPATRCLHSFRDNNISLPPSNGKHRVSSVSRLYLACGVYCQRIPGQTLCLLACVAASPVCPAARSGDHSWSEVWPGARPERENPILTITLSLNHAFYPNHTHTSLTSFTSPSLSLSLQLLPSLKASLFRVRYVYMGTRLSPIDK